MTSISIEKNHVVLRWPDNGFIRSQSVEAFALVMILEELRRARPMWRFCWLIERQIEGRAAWRSLTSFQPVAGWTFDANEAMQFERQKDAEDFMTSDDGDGEIYEAKALEHGFSCRAEWA